MFYRKHLIILYIRAFLSKEIEHLIFNENNDKAKYCAILLNYFFF